MKNLLTLAALSLSLVCADNALAHGEKPKHGGILKSVNDVTYELASKGGKAIIYVEDHGKEIPTTGASGKLTILKGKEKTEVELVASGGNTLTSKAEVELDAGSKVVAAISLPGKEAINVRFAKQ